MAHRLQLQPFKSHIRKLVKCKQISLDTSGARCIVYSAQKNRSICAPCSNSFFPHFFSLLCVSLPIEAIIFFDIVVKTVTFFCSLYFVLFLFLSEFLPAFYCDFSLIPREDMKRVRKRSEMIHATLRLLYFYDVEAYATVIVAMKYRRSGCFMMNS